MKTSLFSTFLLIAGGSVVLADHGPGTSGSGAFTEPAETLRARQWSATTRFEWTEFDSPGASALAGKDHFDLIDRSFLTTFNLGLGVTDNFQLSLAFGYYAADGAREIVHGHGTGDRGQGSGDREAHGDSSHDSHNSHGDTESAHEHHDSAPAKPQVATFDPDGWTDLWLTAKYRVYRGPLGQFAVFGGIKAPVGETSVYNSAGERVEAGATAGTGAWDGMFGVAYTQALAPSLALDASAQYIVRGQKNEYRLGNRLDAGVALGWRIIGGAKEYPQVSLQAEATVRSVEASQESGRRDPNTGGTALFLSPGIRVRWTEHASMGVAVQLPVAQDLNGDQVETKCRLTTSINISF